MNLFTTRRLVEFSHTDAAGVVHFSEYARYFESAEHEFLRSHGLSVSMQHGGRHLSWPRASLDFDFFHPLRFEDEVAIELGVERIGTTSATYLAEFYLKGRLCAKGRCTTVCCEMADNEMNCVDIPTSFRKALSTILLDADRDT